jgi:ABC-type Mn2+/Zn2+ transport system ATPase subunit
MVIAGPNGVGKSTLLYAIKRKQGEVECTGQVLYVSPHRIWRRQNIRAQWLWQAPRRVLDFLVGDSISNIEGIRILDGTRSPDSADEALSAVKYTLSQFETRKQVAVNRVLEARGAVTTSDIGDIYAPIREIATYLLPHLRFSRIDLTNLGDVRCLFKRTDPASSIEIDIDDLSSGERSIISLFMPFLEREIEKRLAAIEAATGAAAPQEQQDLVVLIDEPELHLHPLLQSRLLEYLRNLTRQGNVQFVLATHSPSLLNAASHDELFVLMPPSDNGGKNQLVQLASSADRLAALRDLCGDAQVLTACRSIICIEGEYPGHDRKGPTDMRLLEILCPELGHFVLAPFGSKSAATDAAKRLRDLLPTVLPVVSVHALVDADSDGTAPSAPWVHRLPVAMVENLLLVPDAIWKFIEPYREKLALGEVADVERELQAIAASLTANEIALRVRRSIRLSQVKLAGDSPEELRESLRQQVDALALPDDKTLEGLFATAREEVESILRDGMTLDLFHGKTILATFYEKHIKVAGMSKETFMVEVARIVAGTDSHKDRMKPLLSGLYGPAAPPAEVPPQ